MLMECMHYHRCELVDLCVQLNCLLFSTSLILIVQHHIDIIFKSKNESFSF